MNVLEILKSCKHEANNKPIKNPNKYNIVNSQHRKHIIYKQKIFKQHSSQQYDCRKCKE